MRDASAVDNDQLARICMNHLSPRVRGRIKTIQMKDLYFVSVCFQNGHEVTFRKDWKAFAAECILLHDLPPVER